MQDKITPSSTTLKNYNHNVARLVALKERQANGERVNSYDLQYLETSIKTYKRKYDLRPVDPAKKDEADSNKHYVVMRNGSVKVRLDMTEIHIMMDSKFKYSNETIAQIKADLDAALAIVATAAKMDDKLRPQATIEL